MNFAQANASYGETAGINSIGNTFAVICFKTFYIGNQLICIIFLIKKIVK